MLQAGNILAPYTSQSLTRDTHTHHIMHLTAGRDNTSAQTIQNKYLKGNRSFRPLYHHSYWVPSMNHLCAASLIYLEAPLKLRKKNVSIKDYNPVFLHFLQLLPSKTSSNNNISLNALASF